MQLGLNGRVALVTGGSRGIGRAIARGLAAEGARVAVAARGPDIGAAAEEIGGRGYRFDASEPAAAAALVAAVQADLGPVEIFIANTGGPPPGENPLGHTAEEYVAAHNSLVVTPMAILALIVPAMRERSFGRVVAVSSSAAREPIPALTLSNVNRPGLLAAFKVLARRCAADNVTFNAVLPGRIATDRIANAYGGIEIAEALAREQVPAGRLGTVEEVASAAVYLCSAQAAYVTGQSLLVDGGLTQSW